MSNTDVRTGDDLEIGSLQWLALNNGLTEEQRQWLHFAENVRQASDRFVAFLVRALHRDLEFQYHLSVNAEVAGRTGLRSKQAMAIEDHKAVRVEVTRRMKELVARIESEDERLGH